MEKEEYNYDYSMRFEVFTDMKIWIVVILVMTQVGFVSEGNQL
jgi:hypothetical protein